MTRFFHIVTLVFLLVAPDLLAGPLEDSISWGKHAYRIGSNKDGNRQVLECVAKGSCKPSTCGFPKYPADSPPFEVRVLTVHKGILLAGTTEGLFQLDGSKHCWKPAGPKQKISDIATLTSFGDELYAGRDGGADVCGLWRWAPPKDNWERIPEDGCRGYYSQVLLGPTIYIAGGYYIRSYTPSLKRWCDHKLPVPGFEIAKLKVQKNLLLACSWPESASQCYAAAISPQSSSCPEVSWNKQ
jgi:hypothetical protein